MGQWWNPVIWLTDFVSPKTVDPPTEETHRARATAGLYIGAAALIGAPLAYAGWLVLKKGKKKGKKAELTPSEQMTGIALENASSTVHDLARTALSSPYFALPLAYLGVQMLEELPAAKTIHHPEIGHWDSVHYPEPTWVVDRSAYDEVIPAGVINKELGNAIQGLMALSAAGPMLQGVAGIARSAFTKVK